MKQREWAGGLIETPFYVDDRDPPYRPLAVFWLDMSDGVIVGADVMVPGEEAGAVGGTLATALINPMQGPPRRPDRVRVASEALAAEVREVLDGLEGDAPEVAVAPTPELAAVVEQIADKASLMDGDDVITTYLDMSDVRPESVAAMFGAAAALYRQAPWSWLGEDEVIRLDIPALGVEGACISIIGESDQSRGLTIFPSFADYEAFLNAAESMLLTTGPMDFGTGWFSLTFEDDADLPDALRQEADSHGWPVAAADAFPVFDSFDPDGVRRLLRDLDFRIVSAAVTALNAFVEAEREALRAEEFEPVRMTYHLGWAQVGGGPGEPGDDLAVDLCTPYHAFDDFALPGSEAAGSVRPAPATAPAPPPPKLGRNDPCHCGSGRKYKRCHMAEDEERRIADVRQGENVDERLMRKLIDFACRRFGQPWLEHERAFHDVAEAASLVIPWALFGFEVGGRTVLDWYLREEAWRLSTAERELAAAEQAAWLSIWEVVAVEPGESLSLRDALTGEERRIRESYNARPDVQSHYLLGRIVDHDDEARVGGVHPHALPPVLAEKVVEKTRRYVRRRRDVPVERMRDGKVGRYMIRRWEEASDILDELLERRNSGEVERSPDAGPGRALNRGRSPDVEQGKLDFD